jgi:hypothetical protein
MKEVASDPPKAHTDWRFYMRAEWHRIGPHYQAFLAANDLQDGITSRCQYGKHCWDSETDAYRAEYKASVDALNEAQMKEHQDLIAYAANTERGRALSPQARLQ